jgi:hypothetical protein
MSNHQHSILTKMIDNGILDTGVEAILCPALQQPAFYYAKILRRIDSGPSFWNSIQVGVFQRNLVGQGEPRYSPEDTQVGEYTRNYPSLLRTFHPFQLRGKWYALYSSNYTATRLMELPSCKDIGGEEYSSTGFCPGDYWVPPLAHLKLLCKPTCPRYKSSEHESDYTQPCNCSVFSHREECPRSVKNKEYSKDCICAEEYKQYRKERYIWTFPDRVYGFIGGCQWGDDSSEKIQFLDLSRADEGILKRDERFGYVELPHHLTLNQAVNIDIDEDGKVTHLNIATQKHFNIDGSENFTINN